MKRLTSPATLVLLSLFAASSLAWAGSVNGTKHPLVAEYSVTAPYSGQLSVEFGRDLSYGRSTSSQTVNQNQMATVVVAGMRANTLYHMRARIDYGNQTWYDTDQVFTTGPLPNATHAIPTVTGLRPPGEGVDLVSDLRLDLGPLVLDADGSIIWYYYVPGYKAAFPARLMSNGHIVVQNAVDLREVDLEGNIIRELTLAQLNAALTTAGYQFQVDSMHHDVLRLNNGHYILLTQEHKQVCDPNCVNVLSDTIVDIDQNNNVKWVWRCFDHLDLNRHPYQWPDWTHCNALVYLQNDGNLLLSSRHQSWVMKIQYLDGQGDGTLLWRLGYQGDFTLTPNDPTEWNWDQHDPSVLGWDGSKITIMLFDNGNQRPYQGQACENSHTIGGACYSRGVVFKLDQSTLTANVAWEYKLPFSSWGGSAVLLPDGNVEFDNSADNGYGNASRVVEVTPGLQQIWRMDSGPVPTNWYRSIRIPSLYPGVQW